MKNFIFALIVFCFYAVANTQAQVYQMDTVFFENFENLDAFGTMPTTIKIFDEDSCDFARTGGASLLGDNFRALSRDGGDTAIRARSGFNMWSFQPGQTMCQADDWAIINQAIDITPTTWL